MPAEPKTPSPRRCAWFLTNRTHPSVTEEEQAVMKRLTGSVPETGEAERLSVSFAAMLRERRGSEFAAWLESAKACSIPEVRSFARGLESDRAAVEAGPSEKWSNG